MGQSVNSEEARLYLFGSSRRIRIIWDSYRSIINIARPDRKNPLTTEEEMILARDINLLYVFLRGVLDNLTYAFLHEKEPSILKSIKNKSQIGIFSDKIRSQSRYNDFWKKIDEHRNWMNDVKNRRDPVAHRIPLYVPNAVLRTSEANTYKTMVSDYFDASGNLDFALANKIHTKLYKVGTFVPFFAHHPKEPLTPIYPTLPTDMAHLIFIYEEFSIILQ